MRVETDAQIKEHNRIVKKMDYLDKLSTVVAFGFIGWGVVYFALVAITIAHLVG